MARTNTISESKSKSHSSIHVRDAKDGTNMLGAAGLDKPSAEHTGNPKQIHIGWSLLAFGAFCLFAWGLIFLALRFVL
jgi:hypothetical protein